MPVYLSMIFLIIVILIVVCITHVLAKMPSRKKSMSESIPKFGNRCLDILEVKSIRISVKVLLSAVGCFLILLIISGLVDDVYGIDRIYHEIMQKRHPITGQQIYEKVNFIEPNVTIQYRDIIPIIANSDISNKQELLDTLGSIPILDYQTSRDFYRYFSSNKIFPDIQNFFLSQTLLHAKDKYQTVMPILDMYIARDDMAGVKSIYSLMKEWKWDKNIYSSGYENGYRDREEVIVDCLGYMIENLEKSPVKNDSLYNVLFQYSKEGFDAALPAYSRYSSEAIYFADKRACYAYKLSLPSADCYADAFISAIERFYWTKPSRYSIDNRGGSPGYYKDFFSDPLFLRYKSCLIKKKYRKAEKILEVVSSVTEKVKYNPKNPYAEIHDTLQVNDFGLTKEETLQYAKYDLATISENARLKFLMRKKDYSDWMIGAYSTGVSYLSPTENILESIDSYLYNDDHHFSELLPYMSINYNNPDPRWVYNTALFLKGTDVKISNILMDAIEASNDSSLMISSSKSLRDRVFKNAALNDSLRTKNIRQQLTQLFGNNIKEILSSCFMSYLDVKNKLSPGECAIEIVKVPALDLGDDRYDAVIVRPDREDPLMVPLSEHLAISNVISSGNYYSINSPDLYNLIWAPVERYVKPGETIYLSLDGAISLINVSALANNNKQRLSDVYTINLCVSTKDIDNVRTTNTVSKVALFGGVSYDAVINGYSRTDSTYVAYRGLDCDVERDGFSFLPKTEEEVVFIHDEAKKNKMGSSLYVGEEASEFAFKNLSGTDIDILHIATHGFYYNRKKARDITYFERMSIMDNPLNRCGLIMAGGQHAWLGETISENQEDGILLGSEVARMNLSNVDVVVLSACNTGLGDVMVDGVSGLQKAFKQAGAKSIIMTLDKVGDEPTMIIMKSFYEQLFLGKDKRTAFNLAIETLKANPKYSYPQYWAPFVLLY